MLLMQRLLMSVILTTILTNAGTIPSQSVLLKYIKSNVVKNPQVNIKSIDVIETRTDRRIPGWSVLLTTMNLEYQGRNIPSPQTLFIKDGVITSDLYDMSRGISYKSIIKPTVPESFYNKEHLLFGSQNAKHKIIIFSDPQCPFCQEVVPAIFNAAKNNPSKLAVYYYHLPLLRIHPVSDVLTRVMHVAQHEGKLDVVEKIYSLKIDPYETDMAVILSAVRAHTGYVVSARKVNASSTKKAVKADAKYATRLMVSGTPTIYIDGVLDTNRDGYLKLID